jgi:hypothetical protein
MGKPQYAIRAIDVDTPEIRQQVFVAEQADDLGANLLDIQLVNLN